MVSPLPTSIARFANVTPTVVASAPPRPATPPPPPPNYSLHPALKDFDKKTLVWVGRIDPGVDNELMKNVLMACGPFESWKRVADPTTGEWKKFGFCEFHSAEGALRAFRLLNEFQLGPTPLLLKVEPKVEEYLKEYQTKRRSLLALLPQLERLAVENCIADNDEAGSSNEDPALFVAEDTVFTSSFEQFPATLGQQKRDVAALRSIKRMIRDSAATLPVDATPVERPIEKERDGRRERDNDRDLRRERDLRDLRDLRRGQDRDGRPSDDRRQGTRGDESRKGDRDLKENERKGEQEKGKDREREREDGRSRDKRDSSDAGDRSRKRPGSPSHIPSAKEPKRKDIDAKELVQRIPTDKVELFSYPLAWTVIDDALLGRLRGWVTKKIGELLGEEETKFVDFILERLAKHTPAPAFLRELQPVLDTEAEIFMIKLWRMLIFEILRKQHMER
jgi:RNA recognition motif-containing protein